MRTLLPKCSLLLVVGLMCFIISSCDPPPIVSAADPPLRVTPYNTSPGAMNATIRIDEDQDAVDQLSVVTLQMSTNVIEESNYVHFHHGEYVVCNGVKVAMDDSSQYTFKIDPSGYTCSYVGYKPGEGLLPPVTMFSIVGRSRLHPQAPSFSDHSYTLRYTPDPASLACRIDAVATDSSFQSVTGSSSSSDKGVYYGPDISSLTGTGEIVLKRTCNSNPQNAFSSVQLTYLSTASVEVTWSH